MNPNGCRKTSIKVAKVFYIMMVIPNGIIKTKNVLVVNIYFNPFKKFYLVMLIEAQVGRGGLDFIKINTNMKIIVPYIA